MSETPDAQKTVTIPRWVLVLFAIGVVLDILIGVSLGYVAVQARDAASTARVNRVAAYQACLSGNDRSAADLKRWDDIVTLLRSGRDSPELQTFLAGVDKANGTADAPRDCGRLVP